MSKDKITNKKINFNKKPKHLENLLKNFFNLTLKAIKLKMKV